MTTPRPALAPAGRGPAWEAILGRVPAPVWPAAAGVAVAVSVHVLIGVAGTRDAWLFVAGVVAAGLGLARPNFAINATVVAFVFSGFVRRIFPAADATSDVAAIVPFLVAVPLAVLGLRVAKPLAISLLIGWATLSLALSWLGLIGAGSSPLVPVAGWINLAIPLLAALGISTIHGGYRTLARVAVIAGAAAATYGIVQYFVPFSWDIRWLEASGFVSAGQFGKATFRPFATLASPGTASVFCAVVLLLVWFKGPGVDVGRITRAWAVVACAGYLALSQVRATWLALAAAALVGVLAAKGRPMRQIAAPVVLVVLGVLLTPQGEIVMQRFQSLGTINEDQSFQSRLDLLSRAGELTTPLGQGLGTLSAGARAEGAGSGLDNGYLVMLGELGVIGLGLVVWVLVAVWGRQHPTQLPFLAFFVVINLGGLVFANIGGLLLWTFSGLGSDAPDRGAEPVRA